MALLPTLVLVPVGLGLGVAVAFAYAIVRHPSLNAIEFAKNEKKLLKTFLLICCIY